MKTAILGNINRLKRPRANIHFGKMLLVMLLILGQVLVTNSNKVEASGQTYYYDKYFYKSGFYLYSDVFNDNGLGKNGTHTSELASPIYETTTITKLHSTNIYGENLYIYHISTTYPSSSGNMYTDESYALSKSSSYISQSYYGSDWFIGAIPYRFSGVEYILKDSKVAVSGSGNIKFLLENDLVAGEDMYPINGLHSDGYWYVRKDLANSNPTLIVDNKLAIENSYFSKVNLV